MVGLVAAVTSTAAATRPRRRPTLRLEGGCEGVAKFNLISLGDVRLTDTEVLGAVAAVGDVSLSAFSVNSAGMPDPACDENGASLPDAQLGLVGKSLKANAGSISGRVVLEENPLLGGGTVTSCEVEEADIDAGAVDEYVRQETADICAAAETGCKTMTADGGLLRFVIQAPTDGEAAQCSVSADTLTGASRVEVAGRADPSDMVKIAVHGRRDGRGGNGGGGGGSGRCATNVTLTNMGFDGFVPTSTLFSMCDVPTLTVQDVGLPAAVFAPDTRFRGSSGHVNGTVVVADVKSGVEFQLAPIDCPRRRRRRGRDSE